MTRNDLTAPSTTVPRTSVPCPERHLAAWGVVGLLILAYVGFMGTMALRRHQNLNTHALDLGYTDQAVWNTSKGRFFRFSTFRDAAFQLDIPIQRFREPDVLLGYHVEPILAAIAPLYWIHEGPETLLWLQTAAIALGAAPVYLIARERFRQHVASHSPCVIDSVLRWMPVAFVALYLLSPSLQAANLSDFHAVALTPALLLTAFYFLETGGRAQEPAPTCSALPSGQTQREIVGAVREPRWKDWGFVVAVLLAALCKEEIGLLVAMLGLWAIVARRRWWLGAGTAAAGLAWFVLCVAVIMPHFSGLSGSAFFVRYQHLGDNLPGLLRTLVHAPGLYWDWLRQPDVLSYLGDLVLSSGGLALLYLPIVALAAPSIAVNLFSSYAWMRSGGGHYSAAIVPFLIVAAVYGVDWLAQRASSLPDARRSAQGRHLTYAATAIALTGLGLFVAALFQQQRGVLPFSQRFVLESVREHAGRAQPLIEWVNRLPPEVPISAGSNLYPHVAHRERVYLFPTVSDAQYIFLDAIGPPSPVGTGEQAQIVRELLDHAQFGVAQADHGFLLLERDLDQYHFPATFYQAFQGDDAAPEVELVADFGGLLRLEGFDRAVRPVIRPELVVQLSTYWRLLAPLEEDYQIAVHVWGRDHRRVRIQPEEQVSAWYPTSIWEPGELVKVTLPPLPVGDLSLGVSVQQPGADALDPGGRLVPILPDGEQPLELRESGTILELTP